MRRTLIIIAATIATAKVATVAKKAIATWQAQRQFGRVVSRAAEIMRSEDPEILAALSNGGSAFAANINYLSAALEGDAITVQITSNDLADRLARSRLDRGGATT